MKFEYKDNEFPTGLNEETKNINSKDLKELLKNTVTVIGKLRDSVVNTMNSLSTNDKVLSGDLNNILNVEKDIVNIHNKFNSAIKDLK